jgi:hypothetical protein
VGGGREIIGVGFARYLKDRDGNGLWELWSARKPFSIRPRLKDLPSVAVPFFRQFLNVMESVIYQQYFAKGLGCCLGNIWVRGREQINE